jgi:hypothetical protein
MALAGYGPNRLISCSAALAAKRPGPSMLLIATGNAVRAIERAVLHAGWKVGGPFPAGAALTSAQLDTLEALCPVEATVDRWDTEQPG